MCSLKANFIVSVVPLSQLEQQDATVASFLKIMCPLIKSRLPSDELDEIDVREV